MEGVSDSSQLLSFRTRKHQKRKIASRRNQEKKAEERAPRRKERDPREERPVRPYKVRNRNKDQEDE